jgi:hypothetical protein
MSTSPLSGSSFVLVQQRLAQQSQATYGNPLPQGSDGFDMSSALQPSGSFPPGPAAMGGTAAGADASPSSQAGSVSRQGISVMSYLLGLQPDAGPGSADNAQAPGNALIASNATNAAAASKYRATSEGASSVVSSTMVC